MLTIRKLCTDVSFGLLHVNLISALRLSFNLGAAPKNQRLVDLAI
jgi:hypothetical protein